MSSILFFIYYITIAVILFQSEIYSEGSDESNNPANDFIILSPAEGDKIETDQFFVSVSKTNTDFIVDSSKVVVLLDHYNINKFLLFTEDLILFYPEENEFRLYNGLHQFSITIYDSLGNEYYSAKHSFEIISKEPKEITNSSALPLKFNFQGETRNENFNRTNRLYNSSSINISGEYGGWKMNASVYLTSEERHYLQPQHRYSFNLSTDWLQLSAGDIYPRFPNIILDGKRMRGISGNVRYGFFNLQAAYGEVSRGVEGHILVIYQKNNAPMGSNIIDYPGDNKASLLPGTYGRNLFAVRPYFGKGEEFQFGISYLHSIDDINSIQYSVLPKENIVVGSDLLLGFDDRNILFTSQVGISMTNKDISTGGFTDSLIDSLFGPGKQLGSDPEEVKKINRILSGFITVNQFLSPVNVDQFSTFSSETSLNLKYFNNDLKVTYKYRGNDFQSFGQTFTRTDIRGFNLNDRFRLLENKLFVSLSFEKLNDNLQRTKFATTTYQNSNVLVSYSPGLNLPAVSLGYSNYWNKNDIPEIIGDPLLNRIRVNDFTNRISAQLSYNFFMEVKHSASLSYIFSKRKDYGFNRYNSDNNGVSLNLSSEWEPSFKSSLSAALNRSRSSYSVFNYFSFSVGGSYIILEDVLEVSGLVNPSFGSLKRLVVDLYAKYYFVKKFSLIFDTKYILNPAPFPGNSILSIITRYEI